MVGCEALVGVNLSAIVDGSNDGGVQDFAREAVDGFKQLGFKVLAFSENGLQEEVARQLDVDKFVALGANVCKAELLKQFKEEFGARVSIGVGANSSDAKLVGGADVGIGFLAEGELRKTALVNVEGNFLDVLNLFQRRDLSIIIDNSLNRVAVDVLSLVGNVKVANTADLSKIDGLLKAADVLLCRTSTKLDADFFNAFSNVKAVGVASSGLDRVDLDAAKRANVLVLNAPGGNSDAVADYVLRMIAHLTDDITYIDGLVRAGGNFADIKAKNVRHEFSGKSFGIIGFGNIGRQVATRAESFGMIINAFDPYQIDATASFEQALGSDFISLHLALNDKTRGMIGRDEFAKMKESAIFINASRGEIVNEDDLIKALETRRISKAALDVFPNEPNINPRLLALNNVHFSTHIAGNTEEAKYKSARIIVHKLLNAIQSW